eukprot:1323861-Pleurochrysis_carterae.AAC.2
MAVEDGSPLCGSGVEIRPSTAAAVTARMASPLLSMSHHSQSTQSRSYCWNDAGDQEVKYVEHPAPALTAS